MEVLQVVLFVALLHSATAARCYQCLAIDNPEKCNNLKECPSPNMKCHARQYLVNSVYKYDLDCAPDNVCKMLEPNDSPSQYAEVDMWTSCCDGSYCNKNFDQHGDIIPSENRNRHCYSCLGVADPADCLQTTLCGPNEACLTRERILNGGAQVFDLMCYQRDDCLRLGYHLPFGKRMTLCRACCDIQDNCNNQFCSRKLGITGMEALGSSVRPNIATATPTTSSPYDMYTLSVTPKTQVGTLNSVISFNCALTPKTGSLGNLTLSWYFSGETGSIFSQTVTDPDLKLTVHTLATTDAGTYTCIIQKDGYTWTDTATLSVAGTAFLTFVDGPHDQSVLAGGSATFTCDVRGSPAPTITWQLVHNTNPPVDITKGVTATSTGSQLVLRNVQERDAGIYRCIASNQEDSQAHLAILKVEGSPQIRRGPQSKRVKLNAPVKLNCQVAGVPTPTVQWTFVSPTNWKMMPLGTEINMDDSVVIPKMTPAHVGKWTCHVSNPHGRAEAAADLSIY